MAKKMNKKKGNKGNKKKFISNVPSKKDEKKENDSVVEYIIFTFITKFLFCIITSIISNNDTLYFISTNSMLLKFYLC